MYVSGVTSEYLFDPLALTCLICCHVLCCLSKWWCSSFLFIITRCIQILYTFVSSTLRLQKYNYFDYCTSKCSRKSPNLNDSELIFPCHIVRVMYWFTKELGLPHSTAPFSMAEIPFSCWIICPSRNSRNSTVFIIIWYLTIRPCSQKQPFSNI